MTTTLSVNSWHKNLDDQHSPKNTKKTITKNQPIDLIQQFLNNDQPEPIKETKPDKQKTTKNIHVPNKQNCPTWQTKEIPRITSRKTHRTIWTTMPNKMQPTLTIKHSRKMGPNLTIYEHIINEHINRIPPDWDHRVTNERIPLKQQLTNEETQEIDDKILNDIKTKRKRENNYETTPNKRYRDNSNNNIWLGKPVVKYLNEETFENYSEFSLNSTQHPIPIQNKTEHTQTIFKNKKTYKKTKIETHTHSKI